MTNTYYTVSAFPSIYRKFSTRESAEKAFAEVIRDGFSYVELAKVSDNGNYYAESLKIYHH